ncbi:MAG: hypothetical protein AB7F35_26040 [Acetobacteraceae bacterium]
MNALAGILSSMLLAGAACAAAEDQSQPHIAVVDADGVQRVRILGGDYFFRPDHIVVKVNVPVELSLSKEHGIVPHTFVIDAPGPGAAFDVKLHDHAETVSFIPTLTGRFDFYCRNRLLFFKSHREKGMKGVLEVVP